VRDVRQEKLYERDEPPFVVEVEPLPIDPREILVVRRGPGANCSSIGSALDLLFLSATLAGAVMVAVAASLGPVRHEKQSPPEEDEEGADAGES